MSHESVEHVNAWHSMKDTPPEKRHLIVELPGSRAISEQFADGIFWVDFSGGFADLPIERWMIYPSERG